MYACVAAGVCVWLVSCCSCWWVCDCVFNDELYTKSVVVCFTSKFLMNESYFKIKRIMAHRAESISIPITEIVLENNRAKLHPFGHVNRQLHHLINYGPKSYMEFNLVRIPKQILKLL